MYHLREMGVDFGGSMKSQWLGKTPIWVTVSLFSFLAFQNCSSTQQVQMGSAGGDVSSSSGHEPFSISDLALSRGGEGYDGKVSYVVMSPDGSCADGAPVYNEIQVTFASMIPQSAIQVRHQCADIAPRPLDMGDVEWIGQNYQILVFETVVHSVTRTDKDNPDTYSMPSTDYRVTCKSDTEPPGGHSIVILYRDDLASSNLKAQVYVDRSGSGRTSVFPTVTGTSPSWSSMNVDDESFSLNLQSSSSGIFTAKLAAPGGGYEDMNYVMSCYSSAP